MTGTAVPGDPAQEGPAPATARPGVAHIARVRDYWLGGRDNFAVDRQVGDEAMAAFPGLVGSVRATRAFLGRAVRYLTAEAVSGSSWTSAPASRPRTPRTKWPRPSRRMRSVCYVDRDPVVFGARPGPAGQRAARRASYLEADLRDTGQILAEAASMLDLTQPVAVLLNAVLQFIPDEARPGQDRHHAAGRDAAGQLPGAVPARQRPRQRAPARSGQPARPAAGPAGHPAQPRAGEPVLRRPAAAAARRGPAARGGRTWRPDPAGPAPARPVGPELWGGAGQK